MPSLSGLHMSRTISMGHSSRSSRSIRASSGRRFLANSLRDFTLSFSVLDASMGSSLGGNAAEFTGFVGQFGKELEEVGHLKDRCLGILVNGDQERTSFNASQVLERAADAACQVDLGLHGLSRRTNLTGLLHPLSIDHGPRATHGGTEHLSQFFGKGYVVFFLNAPPDGDQYTVLGDIHIARFSNDRLQIAAPRHQSANIRRLVNDHARGGNARLCFECSGTNVDDRAGGNVTVHVGAHLTAEFLTNQANALSLHSIDRQDIGSKSGVQFDRKPRRQIDSKVIMRDEHNAVGWQNTYLCLPDQFCVWGGKSLVCDLPNFGEGGTERSARGIEILPPAGKDRCRDRGGIDLFCGGYEFGRGIIGDSAFVYDIGKNARHYFSPPFAATSSRTLSAFSSLLP